MTTQTVLITGALTGIGRATALAFGKLGVNIVVSGRRPEAGQALAAELRALGAQAEFIKADVTQEVEVRALIEGAVARFGRLDVAVNNAGVEGQNKPVTEQTEQNYRDTFETNVLGALLSIKHEMRVMQAQGAGAIVNLSSIAGQVGMVGASVYVASKHAVEGLTRSAALEGAPVGVRVNAVAPGPVQTDMLERFLGRDEAVKNGFLASIPARRAATPEEIAETIVWLASDKARYLTGQSVAVDGAYTAQ
ncbi:SDR family NAD(P)-dependent oxidoreductase [Silvimonas iriomotensis]|uniref:SDR family oxidoreductase n=1 Tax=Silvimonas iriomotensis TaxID=449662 RepID=A0ABQ2P4L9_9NEIS|nr:glucose 1-dehydrogenase [Silvimonas iriomotensis]GGP18137.1 SDR family oxidoreductase [Silvimonas iriomotensis]